MIDIKLIRENSDLVKENIKKKFQDEKLGLVDEVYEYDISYRECKKRVDELRARRNELSSLIGSLMREGKKDKAEEAKLDVSKINEEIEVLEEREEKLTKEIRDRMLVIPNIMDSSVPIGKDDSENVEIEKFGDPVVPKYEIPYHADIILSLNGMDKDSAGRTSGEGFYYLLCAEVRLY